MCVCLYVCARVCASGQGSSRSLRMHCGAFVCMYVHVRACALLCMCVSVCMHSKFTTDVQVCVCVCMYVCVCVCVCVCVMHACALCVDVRLFGWARAFACVQTLRDSAKPNKKKEEDTLPTLMTSIVSRFTSDVAKADMIKMWGTCQKWRERSPLLHHSGISFHRANKNRKMDEVGAVWECVGGCVWVGAQSLSNSLKSLCLCVSPSVCVCVCARARSCARNGGRGHPCPTTRESPSTWQTEKGIWTMWALFLGVSIGV